MDVVKLTPRRPRLITDIGGDAKVNFHTTQEEKHNATKRKREIKSRILILFIAVLIPGSFCTSFHLDMFIAILLLVICRSQM